MNCTMKKNQDWLSADNITETTISFLVYIVYKEQRETQPQGMKWCIFVNSYKILQSRAISFII